MKAKSQKITEKLTQPYLVRFTASDNTRLVAQAKKIKKEPVDVIRDAAMASVEQLEFADQRRELERLKEAGIDLKAIVDYAIGRQLAEEAQASLPGIFPVSSTPARA